MQEAITSDFNERVLEADMRHLAGEISKSKEQLETKETHDLELLREALRAFPSQASDDVQDAAPVAGLSGVLVDAPPQSKLEVEYLLHLAFTKGIAKANKEAKDSSPFVLDAFHDMLAGALYPEMQRRGLLK